jgi:nitrite reductase (NO-forming)
MATDSSAVSEEAIVALHEHGNHDQSQSAAGKSAPKSDPLITFGPGRGPHWHIRNDSALEVVDDIAGSAIVKKVGERKDGDIVKIEMTAQEVISEIAPGISYRYWTFDGEVPGPFLRVKEGDTVHLTLNSHPSSTHPHSIDLHAVAGPGGGASLTGVMPGKSKTMQFKAMKPGLFIYHCGTPNVPLHMAQGMYGLILVEPKEGLPPVDKEFYVVQGEIYTEGKMGEKGLQNFDPEKMLAEDPEYVVLNGRVNGLEGLTAETGEKIRIFFGNAGVSKVSSFHIMGEVFDTVYPEASFGDHVHKDVQTTLVPAGGATMVEFVPDVPGGYALLDHALARLDRGAWGALKVTGEEREDLFSAVEKTVDSSANGSTVELEEPPVTEGPTESDPGAGTSATASPEGTSEAGHNSSPAVDEAELLLPDLIPWMAETERALVTTDPETEKKILNFTTSFANIGDAALETVMGEGNEGDRRAASQVLFHTDGTQSTREAGNMEWHDSRHPHYHYEDFGLYRLRQLDENGEPGEVVAGGHEVGLCLSDSVRYSEAEVPGSSDKRIYQDCAAERQGISVGWANERPGSHFGMIVTGQAIEVGHLDPGQYYLEIVVDPEDRLLEKDETNNSAGIVVTI